jgi:hypothetical protein
VKRFLHKPAHSGLPGTAVLLPVFFFLLLLSSRARDAAVEPVLILVGAEDRLVGAEVVSKKTVTFARGGM